VHPNDQDVSHDDAAALIQTDRFRNSDSELGRNSSMARPKIRVLLADDCEQIRQIIVKFLGESPDIEIAGEASNGRVAVELTKLLVPDVVVMDIDMPEMNGIEATRTIRNSLPQVDVVGLSVNDDADRQCDAKGGRCRPRQQERTSRCGDGSYSHMRSRTTMLIAR